MHVTMHIIEVRNIPSKVCWKKLFKGSEIKNYNIPHSAGGIETLLGSAWHVMGISSIPMANRDRLQLMIIMMVYGI